jgi:hypothetical protein
MITMMVLLMNVKSENVLEPLKTNIDLITDMLKNVVYSIVDIQLNVHVKVLGNVLMLSQPLMLGSMLMTIMVMVMSILVITLIKITLLCYKNIVLMLTMMEILTNVKFSNVLWIVKTNGEVKNVHGLKTYGVLVHMTLLPVILLEPVINSIMMLMLLGLP